MTRSFPHPLLSPVLLAVGVTIVCGCAGPQRPVDFFYAKKIPEQARRDAALISADPEAFLRETLARCEQVSAYEVDFYKQERLGLLVKQLRPEEHMHVKFKAQPFSVKMIMLDENHDFAETLYVKGQNNDRLRCKWRRALTPGGTPPINDYDPSFTVTFGRSLNPITDFGIIRLMQRVLATLDQATARDLPPTIEYLGITELEKQQRPVHHIRLRYDPKTRFPRQRVDLLFHVRALLPAACYLWLGNDRLDAKYIYAKFDLNPNFGDEDFHLFTPQR